MSLETRQSPNFTPRPEMYTVPNSPERFTAPQPTTQGPEAISSQPDVEASRNDVHEAYAERKSEQQMHYEIIDVDAALEQNRDEYMLAV